MPRIAEGDRARGHRVKPCLRQEIRLTLGQKQGYTGFTFSNIIQAPSRQQFRTMRRRIKLKE